MLNKTIITAAVLAVTAGAAAAMDAPSPGEVQLANLAGVEPGVYSVADLIRLDDSYRETNSAQEQRFILDEGRDGIAGRANSGFGAISTSAGAVHNAATVNVDGGIYTTGEIALIDAADGVTNDRHFVAFVKDGGLRDNTANVTSSSPAAQQLAGALGLDAGDFTLSQLVRLDSAAEENNRVLVDAILNEAGVSITAEQVLR